MHNEKTYDIGGKTYSQGRLVLGQMRQLRAELEGVELPVPPTVLNVLKVIEARLPRVLAVVLTEKGQSLGNKDLTALARELEFNVTAETAMDVVEDFLDCNPVVSLLDRMKEMTGKLRGKLPNGLSNSASSSLEETSPSAEIFYGP